VEEISIGEFARRPRRSLKALRRYDERGVLVPSRVDQALAAVKELLACDPADAAKRIAEHWRDAEAAHDARRGLADYLVNRLHGKRSVMYEVATREMPERSLLCLKRNVDEQGQWAFGKEFIAILRERPLPKIEGREGAFFCIYWGMVSGDSDGPVEWCRPVPETEAQTLAERYPDLTLRTEPAHREAFVALPVGPAGVEQAVHWQLAIDSLQAWKLEQGIEDERLTLKPEDLGLRITYLATGPVTGTSVPDDYGDFAVPFA
jgi:hypothetical protein